MIRLGSILLLVILASLKLSAQVEAAPSFTSRWLARVTEIQSQQPRWMSPLTTISGKLDQSYRYDLFRQVEAGGFTRWNSGGNKGLEIIPFDRVQVVFTPPVYLAHESSEKDGFGDAGFLMKYRIVARNNDHGNYLVTAFLNSSIPTGSSKNGLVAATVSPNLAAGKGFGRFNVQSTFGAVLPVEDTATIGRTMQWNTAFQYRVREHIWPELELNHSHFFEGKNDGQTQVFLTPGVIFGRFPIRNRSGFTFGAGMQFAVSQFHTTDHNIVMSFRMPF
jgi:hypothetical protein